MPSDQSTEIAPRGHDEGDDRSGAAGAIRPMLAIVVVTAVLYFAKDLLLPIAMASILAVVFSPVAQRLEPILGRILSSALVVIAAVAAVAGIIYFLSVQLTSVAVEVAGYSNNIATKLSRIEKSTPSWLQQVEKGFENVQKEMQRGQPRHQRNEHASVVPVPTSQSADQFLKTAGPVVTAAAEAALVIVLLFFLLYSRDDLRDRFVRLAARGGIRVAAKAIDAAGTTISHYLFLFSMINLSYGISTGLILWLLGMPNPQLWGVLGFLLRYIPYVGATASALMPTAVAFAVFPGWGKAAEVFAAFIILDQVAAQFVEPFLIGHGIGISPVALLFSAAYWAWLWGPVGLVLATPLTACIKVAGDYIPELDFFALLLGADNALEDYHDYYRKLLELDRQGAQGLATRYCDEHGLEAVFRDIFVNTLRLAGAEFEENHIAPATMEFVIDTTRELIAELGNRFSKPLLPARFRVLGVCAPGETHSMGLLMLLELLRQDGMAASFAGENKPSDEIRDFVNRFTPDLLFLSCTLEECVPRAAQLVKLLRADRPTLTLIAGGNAAIASAGDLLAAGCARICANDSEARRAARHYAVLRSRSRSQDARRFTLRMAPRPQPPDVGAGNE
jgi:predicted PurR-regulated permease PerM/methanogenic corrinoid protein MtbC1